MVCGGPSVRDEIVISVGGGGNRLRDAPEISSTHSSSGTQVVLWLPTHSRGLGSWCLRQPKVSWHDQGKEEHRGKKNTTTGTIEERKNDSEPHIEQR